MPQQHTSSAPTNVRRAATAMHVYYRTLCLVSIIHFTVVRCALIGPSDSNASVVTDIDECLSAASHCSQWCSNTVGSFNCRCAPGYILEDDKVSCRAKDDTPPPVLFYVTGSSIRSRSLRPPSSVLGTSSSSSSAAAVDFVVADHLSHPESVTFDGSRRRLFWSETSPPSVKGKKINLARSEPSFEVANRSVVKQPEGIAYDWLGDLLYVVDSALNKIVACKPDREAPLCVTVIPPEETSKMREIVVHPYLGIMFWTDWQDKHPRIETAGLDGSKRQTVVDTNITWPNDLAIDYLQNQLYWIDAYTDRIERCNFNGSGREVVVSNLPHINPHSNSQRQQSPHPRGLTLFENHIYWSDMKDNVIWKVNKLRGQNPEVVVDRLLSPSGVFAYHPLLQQATVRGSSTFGMSTIWESLGSILRPINPCAKHQCSHMCLLAPGGTFTCRCPPNFELSADKLTCRPSACSLPNHVHCGTLLHCIPAAYVCNGRVDCPNKWDEQQDCFSTPPECTRHQFLCRNDLCIDAGMRCNGVDECGDGSDESDCPQTDLVRTCSSDQYRCETGECIDDDFRCDGLNDCPHGDDESDCPTGIHICPLHNGVPRWSCFTERELERIRRNNTVVCIPLTLRCDGNKDCTNGADERGCNYTMPTSTVIVTTSRYAACQENQFACKSGTCIPRVALCDGNADCPGRDDEGDFCDACRSHACEQGCVATPDGARCACRSGFELGSDGLSCDDINECAQKPSPCDHFCDNRPGTFVCSCAAGYDLYRDDRTCFLKKEQGNVLVSTAGQILNMPLFTNPYRPGSYGEMTIVDKKDINRITSLSYNFRTNKLYFGVHDSGHIFIKNGGQEWPLVEGIGGVQTIAVDWLTENVYYTADQPSEVGMCNADGSYCQRLHAEGLFRARGLALHPIRGIMFWSDWQADGVEGQGRIETAWMDGSNRRHFLTDKLGWPNALAIDYVRQELFWTDAKLELIGRIALDGTDRRTVATAGVVHPFSLAVFDHRLFWTDWHNFEVNVADLSRNNERQLLHRTSSAPYGLTIMHEAYQIQAENRCILRNCTHICALTPQNASCLCPNGYRITDAKKCLPDIKPFEGPHMARLQFKSRCNNMCQNGGICGVSSYACTCKHPFGGLYCEVAIADVARSQGGGNHTWVAALIIVLLLVCLLVFVLLYVMRHGLNFTWRRPSFSMPVTFRNRLQSDRKHFAKEEVGHNEYTAVDSFDNPCYEIQDTKGSDCPDEQKELQHRPVVKRAGSSGSSGYGSRLDLA